jgi:hypothetical protein
MTNKFTVARAPATLETAQHSGGVLLDVGGNLGNDLAGDVAARTAGTVR